MAGRYDPDAAVVQRLGPRAEIHGERPRGWSSQTRRDGRGTGGFSDNNSGRGRTYAWRRLCQPSRDAEPSCPASGHDHAVTPARTGEVSPYCRGLRRRGCRPSSAPSPDGQPIGRAGVAGRPAGGLDAGRASARPVRLGRPARVRNRWGRRRGRAPRRERARPRPPVGYRRCVTANQIPAPRPKRRPGAAADRASGRGRSSPRCRAGRRGRSRSRRRFDGDRCEPEAVVVPGRTLCAAGSLRPVGQETGSELGGEARNRWRRLADQGACLVVGGRHDPAERVVAELSLVVGSAQAEGHGDHPATLAAPPRIPAGQLTIDLQLVEPRTHSVVEDLAWTFATVAAERAPTRLLGDVLPLGEHRPGVAQDAFDRARRPRPRCPPTTRPRAIAPGFPSAVAGSAVPTAANLDGPDHSPLPPEVGRRLVARIPRLCPRESGPDGCRHR